MTKTKLFCLISGILALLALGAVPINFKDIASTNVVKTNDLALIDADLGGGSYATRTTVYKLILDKLSKAQATNALAMNGDPAQYTGQDGNGHALPAGGIAGTLVNTNGIISLTPAAPQTITFSVTNTAPYWLVATGDVAVASTALSAGAKFVLYVDNSQATNINVVTPVGWRLVSGAATNILAPYAIGILSCTSRASSDTNCVSLWASE